MVVLLTCYSRFANFKTMFERNGIFAKMKLSRELCILSNGHFITLNDEQADFIDKMAKQENIEKDVEIVGAVGSGKTILGEQVVIMKLNHYKEKYQILPMECKQKFRVIFLDCSSFWNGLNTTIDTALIDHWKSEVTKMIGHDCTLEVISQKFGFDFIAADPNWRDYRYEECLIYWNFNLQTSKDVLRGPRRVPGGKMYQGVPKESPRSPNKVLSPKES